MLDLQQVGAGVIAIAGVVGNYINSRRGVQKAIDGTQDQHNQELRALAQTRWEEITELRGRVKDLENERDGLESLYQRSLETVRYQSDELVRLKGGAENLRNENNDLQRRNQRLRQSANETGDLP